MKDHPPPEATSQQTFLEDLNRQVGGGHQVTDAHHAGGYTAVLKLARERLDELQREFATLTAGHELRRMTKPEWEEHRRQWTPEEARVKGRLNAQIAELDWQIRGWEFVAGQVAGYAEGEALGWAILPDLTSAKVLDNGKVVSTHGWVSQWEEDGQTYTSDGPDEQWKRRHRHHACAFGENVRRERLARAHNGTRPIAQQRAREHRPATTRRAASSSSTSSADPPDDEDSSSGGLRHISGPLTAELVRTAERLRAKGGVG